MAKTYPEVLKKHFVELIRIAKMPGSYRDPFICSDRMDQENLYAVQEAISNLMLEMSKSLPKDSEEMLLKELPYLFKAEEVKPG